MRELVVKKQEEGQRLDKFLRKYMPLAGTSFLYKMLRKKNITANGQKADGSLILREGDTICLYLSDETVEKFRSQPMKAETVWNPQILYEDRDILIINKEPGILSQPGGKGKSVAELLVPFLLDSGRLTGEDLRAFRPAPLNRLDRNTSGILVCSMSLSGAQKMSGLLRSRDLVKEYLVIACGTGLKDGIFEAWAAKDEKQNRVILSDRENRQISGAKDLGIMRTGITVLEEKNGYSLLCVRLITGKTHQIRAHLAWLGCPVAGDRKYGVSPDGRSHDSSQPERQMLHAWRMSIPENAADLKAAGRTITAPVPQDMRNMMKQKGFLNENVYLSKKRADS